MMDIFIALYSNCCGKYFYSALMNGIIFLFSLVECSELSQSKAEGFHQKGQKSTQTGPDQQFQTNDFAPVSKCRPREVSNLYCL